MQRSTSPPPGANQALQVCTSCKLRKRKCDKGLPKCALCFKNNWNCDYATADPNNNGASRPWPSVPPITDGRRNMESIDLPVMLFLDSRVLQHSRIDMSVTTIPIPTHVTTIIGNVTNIRIFASHFFDTIQSWMPIISKKRFYDHYLHPLSQPRADLALLFLCMKLIISMPPKHTKNPQTPTYLAAKQFYLEVETAGIFSIQVLQAGVLISLYELGHAIYPSAFISIGGCARYAYGLGINGNAASQICKPFTWVEQEETRRVWWAIVILDRVVCLGYPGRRFATEDPNPHDLLPANDAAWDNGVVTANDSCTISSPSSSHMSSFALLAQAAWLLGQVLKHVSSNTSDRKLYDEEGMQLDRTLHALIAASDIASSPPCDQATICYSALMALHEPWISSNISSNSDCFVDSDCSRYAKTVTEAISKMIAAKSPQHLPEIARNTEMISPWGSHMIYRAIVTYTRMNREVSTSDSLEALKVLQQTLRVLGMRWKAAGAYLQLLEAREIMSVY